MIGGMDKTVLLLLLWRSHNNDQIVHVPIIHVAGAVTDTDETYGAYVAAENNTFNNTNNSNSNAKKSSFSKKSKVDEKSVFRHHRPFNPMKNYEFSIFNIEF